ncbi:outer membrane lipoprotein chaperone LolA [Gilvimarinus sp. DA14]|uniref:outer membrane lipoprotein chaperone LolA n=1 Tax=Gilvimarinus sp. DA14 TaxID=2956798 RepID=UPI0020B8060C|nr:outer membrane lipoprotein chaperone LolA [Gilvimarinus sp. DA14]UTF60325.1 outer membrane lipoprotein chaperone LolA [Gilvimarinus sp. DA14]
MKLIVACLTGLILCSTPWALAQQQAAVELTEKLHKLVSLKGEFTQVLQDESGSELERSQGEFVLQKPGRFYWQTHDPFPQTLVSNGETIWLYDPDLMQVTVRQVSDDLQRTPALLLSESAAKVAQAYKVSEPVNNQFVLEPREEDALFESLTLVFAADQVAQIQLLDGLGQTTVFTFESAQQNQPVDESLFEFAIPEGVDVLID